MMKPTNKVVCCVVDNGGNYLPQAHRLAQEYSKVYYTNPSWVDAYPKMNKPFIGYGLKDIEVVETPWEIYDEIDLWVFPDTYNGPFIEWLKAQGEIVWGSGVGEELELERDLLKEHTQELGLPVSKWENIVGLTNLRVYLQKHEDVYVKISKWRGTVETFHSQNYKLIKPELDEMEHCLGPFANIIEFVVEQPVPDAVEIGFDGWTIDGAYPEYVLAGVEIKDKAYVGKFSDYSDLSTLITGWNDKYSSTFKNYQYRGFMSTEIRVDNTKTPYMIDFTARTPCPPGEIYLCLYENLGEVIWEGANGNMILPKARAKYGVELLMESDWATHNFQAVYYPPKYAEYVKLKKACKIDGVDYIIPQSYGSNDIGAVVGLGDTLEEAIKDCLDVADSIEGNGICLRKDTFDTAREEFDKFEAIK